MDTVRRLANNALAIIL